MVLDNMKKAFLFILGISLIILWCLLFIVQGGVGIEGPIFLTPFKFIPIFFLSGILLWIFFKSIDSSLSKGKVKAICLSFALLSSGLSLQFQVSKISRKMTPFKFENKMFSHLPKVKVSGEFKTRLGMSAVEFLNLIPFSKVDKMGTEYMTGVAAEASLVFELKKFIEDKNLEETCKLYIENYGDYSSCVIDFQKEIYQYFTFSSTGNILLVAVGALGVFKVKEKMKKKYGDKSDYVAIKAANDIIETTLLSANKTKYLVERDGEVIPFSMGHKLDSISPYSIIEDQVNYKYLETFMNKISSLRKSVEKKLNKIDADSGLLREEKERFLGLTAEFLVFQEDGFTLDELKVKNKKTTTEMKSSLEKSKKESLILKATSYFNLIRS